MSDQSPEDKDKLIDQILQDMADANERRKKHPGEFVSRGERDEQNPGHIRYWIEHRAERGREYAASKDLTPEDATREILDKADTLPMDTFKNETEEAFQKMNQIREDVVDIVDDLQLSDIDLAAHVQEDYQGTVTSIRSLQNKTGQLLDAVAEYRNSVDSYVERRNAIMGRGDSDR